MSAVTTRTPEEKKQILQNIKADLKNDAKMTVAKACEKYKISVTNYYNWQQSKSVGTKIRRRKRTKVETTTALVPLTAETETPKFDFNNANFGNGRKPNPSQVANLLAEMNARSNVAALQAMFGE